VKHYGRAVRADATRSGAPARQVGCRTHCRCTIDVSTSSRDPVTPQSQIPQILHFVHTQKPVAQNDETPVGSAFRGLAKRLFRGLPSGQPRNSRRG
jgi:hypothetical protein